MYICICRAVTEEQVKQAIDDGAVSVEAVTRACCAGDDCGACHGVIEELIEERTVGPGPRKLPVLGERAA
ncbi:MAG TPA: (2Fe-2S)-binding protein [Polyangiaceae bacterium]|nr:(2Fe-2S)-binding protein [Polyangiaceae bacterium]